MFVHIFKYVFDAFAGRHGSDKGGVVGTKLHRSILKGQFLAKRWFAHIWTPQSG